MKHRGDLFVYVPNLFFRFFDLDDESIFTGYLLELDPRVAIVLQSGANLIKGKRFLRFILQQCTSGKIDPHIGMAP